MANNPRHMENLRNFDSETGRAAAKKSAQVRSAFAAIRKGLLDSTSKVKDWRYRYWIERGVKTPNEMLCMWAPILKAAEDEGNYKAVEAFQKAFGIHWDSNKEHNITATVEQKTELSGGFSISFDIKEPERIEEDGNG